MRNRQPAHAARGAPPAAVAPLELTLQVGRFANTAKHRALLDKRHVGRWIAHALEVPAEMTVRIVGEPESRALNRRYRGKDYPTYVLTFAYVARPRLLADLVLCAPVIEREAREQGKSLRAHYAHLLVHGALHAQGWDHETGERDALEMEALEILLLGALGFANPY
jgi:probable rRNA maturation factor